MAQAAKQNQRKLVVYKGQRAWLYDSGLILNAKTGRMMKGGARFDNQGMIPIEIRKPEVLERIRYALSIDCNIQECCIYAGIHAETLKRIFERNLDFAMECAVLKMETPMAARKTVAKAVKDDPKTALRYLELKRNKEFRSGTDVDANIAQPVSKVTRKVLSADATREIVDEVMNGEK